MSETNPPTYGTASPAVGAGETQDAKDRAADVASHAGEAARDVTREAGELAREVATEAKQRAGTLLDQAKTEVGEQASVQQERAVRGLRSFGAELGRMRMATTDPGYASELAARGSEMAGRMANWLEQRQPGDVVREVAEFARRKPGVFLAIAAGAGVAAGRLLRGATEASSESSDTARHGYAATGTTSTVGAPLQGASSTPRPSPTGTSVAEDPYGRTPTRPVGTPSTGSPGVATGGAGHVPGV